MHTTLYDQKGSITILAIVTVVFLGVVIAALLPLMTQEVKISAMDRDVLEARYAAEAGIKRAQLGLSQRTNNWQWLRQDRPYVSSSDLSKVYNVNIKDQNGNDLLDGTIPAAGQYTIYSSGRIVGASQILPPVSFTVQ